MTVSLQFNGLCSSEQFSCLDTHINMDNLYKEVIHTFIELLIFRNRPGRKKLLKKGKTPKKMKMTVKLNVEKKLKKHLLQSHVLQMENGENRQLTCK